MSRDDAVVIESGIAPVSLSFGESVVVAGTWWIGVAILSADLLQRIQQGALFTPTFLPLPSLGAST